ncbi:MAG: DUF1559 domain-containing protein [Planctomycetia bacterium]|nr:DUF1559 domain-containing protein [Planctomycetia bacterium]
MKRIENYRLFFVLSAIFVLTTFVLQALMPAACAQEIEAREAQRVYGVIKPWITKDTLIVAHERIEAIPTFVGNETLETLERMFPRTLALENEFSDAVAKMRQQHEWLEDRLSTLRDAGGEEFFLCVSMKGAFVVCPFTTDDEAKIEALRCWFDDAPPEIFGDASKMTPVAIVSLKDKVLILSAKELLPNLDEMKPVEEPRFLEGFELVEDSPLKVVFVMNASLKAELPQFISEAKENGPPISIPSAALVAQGFDIVAIGWDMKNYRNTQIHILSASEKAAQLLTKYHARWQEETIENAVADSEDNALLLSLQKDMIRFGFKLFEPTQEGRHLWFDFAKNMENFPAFEKRVPLAVAGVGLALLLPAVSSSREAARQMQTQNCVKQCALAMLNYEASHGAFPPAYTMDAEGKPLHSWRVLLLPYIEQGDLYNRIRLDEPWDSEWNSQFHETCPFVYKDVRLEMAPSEATVSVVVGENTLFTPDGVGVSRDEVSDGLNNTILLVERKPFCWMDPTADLVLADDGKSFTDPQAINGFPEDLYSAKGDGSVHIYGCDEGKWTELFDDLEVWEKFSRNGDVPVMEDEDEEEF